MIVRVQIYFCVFTYCLLEDERLIPSQNRPMKRGRDRLAYNKHSHWLECDPLPSPNIASVKLFMAVH